LFVALRFLQQMAKKLFLSSTPAQMYQDLEQKYTQERLENVLGSYGQNLPYYRSGMEKEELVER